MSHHYNIIILSLYGPLQMFSFLGGGGRGASLVAQMVKNLPAMGETQVQPLKEGLKEMATHSSILAWRRIPWIEESGGLQSTYKCFYYFTIMLAYFVFPSEILRILRTDSIFHIFFCTY